MTSGVSRSGKELLKMLGKFVSDVRLVKSLKLVRGVSDS